MSQIEQKRRERAATGSRRRRDLAAAGIESVGPREAVELSRQSFANAHSWATEYLPSESPNFAGGAYLNLRYRTKREPSVEDVRAYLKSNGRDKASLTTGEPK